MNLRFLSVVFIFFTSLTCLAQIIPVSKEPMHHNVFQNKYVRILDVHVQPGDTSLFHKHETPSVFVVLSNAKTGSELIREDSTVNAPVTYGNIWFDGFYTKPRIHRVWNSDTIEFHVMDIELLNKQLQNIDSPWRQASVKLLFDEKPVRTYIVSLDAAATIQLQERKAPLLIISLSDSLQKVMVNGKGFKQKGDYLFLEPLKNIAFVNKGSQPASFAVLELR